MNEGPDHEEDQRIDGAESTPFTPILLYVLGFMGALALLALLGAWLLRRL
jgi:hypothetical protein